MGRTIPHEIRGAANRVMHLRNLAALTELGQYLGIKKNVLDWYRIRRPDFPKPVLVLSVGRVWDRREVRRWYREFQIRKRQRRWSGGKISPIK